jgi:hypothetical protein
MIPLSPAEVALLWSGILAFAHPDHWTPTKWGPESRITREYYDELRKTSYALIARFADSMTKGGRLVTPLSVDSRNADFFQTSNFESKFEWPHLPPEMPQTVQQWEARKTHYSVPTDHVGFVEFQQRLQEYGRIPDTLDSLRTVAEDTPAVPEEPEMYQVNHDGNSNIEMPAVTADLPVVLDPTEAQDNDKETIVLTEASAVETEQADVDQFEPEQITESQAQFETPQATQSSVSTRITCPNSPDRLFSLCNEAEYYSQDDGDDNEEESYSEEEGYDQWDLQNIGPSVPMEYGSEQLMVNEETFNRMVEMVQDAREEQRRLAVHMMLEDIEPGQVINQRMQTLATLGVHGIVAFAEELLEQSNARANEVILAMNTLITNNNRERDRLVQKAQEQLESRLLLDELKGKFRTSSTSLADQRQAAIVQTPSLMSRTPLLPQAAGRHKPRTLNFGGIGGTRHGTPALQQGSRRLDAQTPRAGGFTPATTQQIQPTARRDSSLSQASTSRASAVASGTPSKPNERRDPLHDRMMGQRS